jgi:hypothetical protein
MKAHRYLITILLLGLAACTTVEATIQSSLPAKVRNEPVTHFDNYDHLGLTKNEVDTLLSLTEVDGYPLYTMHYYANFDNLANNLQPVNQQLAYQPPTNNTWACSLFAAFAASENRLYGRNFDWEFSPAILLYTYPPDGYASATMVDIAYLGFAGDQSKNLTEKPLDELVDLLDAPYLPFDGINEAGLAIGMAAVPAGNVPIDPKKDTLGSLGVIRAVLDTAADVDEALEILQNHNIDFTGGPPVHYLLADAHGKAALLEHYEGEIHIFRNQTPWQQATNFLTASVDSPTGQCWRYDTISERLEAAQGSMTTEEAMRLLENVSQVGTQWSVVYNLSRGDIHIVMGKDYENEHVLPFELTGP